MEDHYSSSEVASGVAVGNIGTVVHGLFEKFTMFVRFI